MGADSLEDLMQQQQKPPVAKNDSFERIGSDEGDLSPQQRSTFLTEVEIPAAEAAAEAAAAETSEDVSDLLRDAQKVPSAFALLLQQNRNDLSATFSSLLSGDRECETKSEVS